MLRQPMRFMLAGLAGLLGLVCGAPLLLAADPPAGSGAASLMIYDGGDAAKGGGWISPKGEKNKIAPSEEAYKGKKSLEFRGAGKGYIGCGWNWCGWWPKDAGTDLSGYKEMRFYIRVTGDSKPDEVTVCLVSNGKNRAASKGLAVSKYAVDKDKGKFNDGQWHEIVIPVEAFVPDPKKPGFELKKCWEVMIGEYSRVDRDFAVNLDSIRFERPGGAEKADDSKGSAGVVDIKVDTKQGRRPISPYLFGNNNQAPKKVTAEFAREVGMRLSRNSGGNNCTKLNWRDEVTSAPDWYNNVYPVGRTAQARKLSTEYEDLQILYGLPALGWAAKADGGKHNFTKNDGAKVWPVKPSPKENLCGDGQIDRYLQKWTPKDAVDMLDHFFKPRPGGLGLDPSHFKYVHLDNEPECWSSTHDDVCPEPMTAEECVQKYVALAKELRKRYPKLKLLAPGFTAEWFWWNWGDNKSVDGMPWMEYFVKRMAEESKKSGVKLIDVVDFHTYLNSGTDDAGLLQEHRIFYDADYEFARSRGVQTVKGEKVERVFGRMEEWLDHYFGPGHGITLAVTECTPGKHSPMAQALWYASMLGTFADHGIEIFAPWEWREPMWEVMHLFSQYGRAIRVKATSSDDEMVSAYASATKNDTGITIILLNREPETPRKVHVAISGFTPKSGPQETLTLVDLPKERTFRSHADNALKKGTVEAKDSSFDLTLPPYSIVAVVMQGS